MLRLTPHFTLDELIKSDAAKQYGIENVPTTEHLNNLKITAYGLEASRLILGSVPMIITSGYRCPALNERIYSEQGKKPTQSAHTLGFAADFHCFDKVNNVMTPLAKTARALAKMLPYDQLIYEPGRCVHISFDPRLRMQVLTQRDMGGPTVEGIVE